MGLFDLGLGGGDSILSRLFGQSSAYTPQTDALLAAPDTNSGGQMGGPFGGPLAGSLGNSMGSPLGALGGPLAGLLGGHSAAPPAPPMGNSGQMPNALPMGDPSGLVAHTTTPNPPMGNGIGGMLGLDDDKMKQLMMAMQTMQNSRAQPVTPMQNNRPPMMPQQFSSFGGMGQSQGQTSPQTQQLLNLLQMAGTRRF